MKKYIDSGGYFGLPLIVENCGSDPSDITVFGTPYNVYIYAIWGRMYQISHNGVSIQAQKITKKLISLLGMPEVSIDAVRHAARIARRESRLIERRCA